MARFRSATTPILRRDRDRLALLRKAGRWLLQAMAGATVLLLVAGATAMAIWPPINDVTTGQTPEYPDLQPRAYTFSRDRVFYAVLECIEADDRMTAVSSDLATGVVEAEAQTLSRTFTDDVTIRVEPNGDGGAIVFVRSRSRVGRADFGQNARTIQRLYTALDERLGTATP